MKRVRRLVSGQTEVARICGDARRPDGAHVQHTAHMTSALWNEWSTSKKLQPLFTKYARDPDMPVDEVAAEICGTKKIAESLVVYVFHS